MSVIIANLEDAKRALKEYKRKRTFKKANKEREEEVALVHALSVCRGKLEVCKNDFKRTVRSEALNIKAGNKIGADTTIQEKNLGDAAVGYMLVRDAAFSLETISSFDSVTHAYEMLGAALDMMENRGRKLPKMPKIGALRSKNAYGYISSSAALYAKQEILASIYEELLETGDIEKCLEEFNHAAEVDTGRRSGSSDGFDEDRAKSFFGTGGSSETDLHLDAAGLDEMMDIHPRKKDE